MVGPTYQLLKTLQTKISYEKSFRLPTDNELFGDGDLRDCGNYKLKPENSNNLNVNLSYQPAFNCSLLVEAGFAYRYIELYHQKYYQCRS